MSPIFANAQATPTISSPRPSLTILSPSPPIAFTTSPPLLSSTAQAQAVAASSPGVDSFARLEALASIALRNSLPAALSSTNTLAHAHATLATCWGVPLAAIHLKSEEAEARISAAWGICRWSLPTAWMMVARDRTSTDPRSVLKRRATSEQAAAKRGSPRSRLIWGGRNFPSRLKRVARLTSPRVPLWS